MEITQFGTNLTTGQKQGGDSALKKKIIVKNTEQTTKDWSPLKQPLYFKIILYFCFVIGQIAEHVYTSTGQANRN
jgi:hypothetical protein